MVLLVVAGNVCVAATDAGTGTATEPATAAQTEAGKQGAKHKVYLPGPADDCKRYPEYARNLGFKGPVYLSTNLRGHPGLVFIGQ
ncbi:MAG: hypothetical protein WB783_07150, partial [Arenicellales bacterium]